MKALSLAVLAFTLAPGLAKASAWDIDPAHTTAGFTVRHMMINNVRGEFGKTTGKVVVDDKDVTKSTAEATIDATTIDTRNADRDKHLKSPDFFDVEKFPTLTFKSTKVAQEGKDKLKVTGDLTIHGVTKPVTLDVEFPATEMKDPWGNIRRAATLTGKINRKDFGLIWNKTLDGGGVLVGDEVNLEVNVELTKAAATPKG